jgi:hypothetical protein
MFVLESQRFWGARWVTLYLLMAGEWPKYPNAAAAENRNWSLKTKA